MVASALANINEKPYENLFNLANTIGTLNKYDFTNEYINTILKSSKKMYPKL